MSTYLELCQEAAQLSGTIDRRTVATVEAGGRVGLLADLVRAAWTEIQNQYRAWRFLVVDIPEAARLGENIPAFEANALNIDDWAEWIPGIDEDTVPLTVWPAEAIGDEDASTLRNLESAPTFVEYREFRQAYQTGSSLATAPATPRAFSIDIRDRLVFWPKPDRDYRLAGTYRRAAQVLSADGDVPLIARQFQDAIVWSAVLLLHRADEAEAAVILTTEQGVQTRMAALRRRYLKPTALAFESLGAASRGSVRPLSTPAPT